MNTNLNYIQLIKKILDYANSQDGIHFSGEGDIYQINSINVFYPVFWVSSTQAHEESENYFTYNLTFYYIDRQLEQTDEFSNQENANISSAGISIISNIIRRLREDEDILEIPNNIQYTVWTDTEIFSDKCAGVYSNVRIIIPKDNCID